MIKAPILHTVPEREHRVAARFVVVQNNPRCAPQFVTEKCGETCRRPLAVQVKVGLGVELGHHLNQQGMSPKVARRVEIMRRAPRYTRRLCSTAAPMKEAKSGC